MKFLSVILLLLLPLQVFAVAKAIVGTDKPDNSSNSSSPRPVFTKAGLEQINKNNEEINNLFNAIDASIKRIDATHGDISKMLNNQEKYVSCIALDAMQRDIKELESKTNLDNKDKENLTLYIKSYGNYKNKLSDKKIKCD
jgi:hypothetical protein